MTLSTPLIIATIFLGSFILLIYVYTGRIKNGYLPVLRPICSYEVLKGLTGRAIESGRTLHLSLGVGSVADPTTADTLAGLAVLDYLAEQTAVTGIPPTISMADPMVMLYAQSAMQAACASDPNAAREAQRQIRWIAPQPIAYAAGVMNILSLDSPEANVMIGNFGDEYLLMGEVAVRREAAHIGGSSNPNTLPFIYASAEQASLDETLLGEDIYAAGAYLSKRASHIASLVTQDIMRWAIALAILISIIIGSVKG